MKVLSVNILSSIPLFSGLDKDTFGVIGNIVTNRTYAPRDIVIHEGEESTYIFFVINGRVRVSSTTRDGKEIILQILSKGDFFGDVSNFDGINNYSTVTSLSKTELLLIRISDFQNLLLNNGIISIRLLQELAKRIRSSEFRILLLSFNTAQDKIATLILQIAEKEGEINDKKIIIENFPPFSEIAHIVGTIRETVSRILHRFENQRLIKLGKLKLTILDYEKFGEMFDLFSVKTDINPNTKNSSRSLYHLPRRGRFPILGRAEFKKVLIKYSYQNTGLVKNRDI